MAKFTRDSGAKSSSGCGETFSLQIGSAIGGNENACWQWGAGIGGSSVMSGTKIISVPDGSQYSEEEWRTKMHREAVIKLLNAILAEMKMANRKAVNRKIRR